MQIRTLHFILAIIIAAFLGYFVGSHKSTQKQVPVSRAEVVNKEASSNLKNVDFSLFWNVWQKLENTYYDKSALDTQKMVNGAITGMVQSLGDPYTMYLPPIQNNDFKQGLAGQFEGIGAELGVKDKQIVIVAPLTGSPAEKAGIKPGDAILKVDNEIVDGWTISQTVQKIRGPKGTPVTLTILHKNEQKPKQVKIIRDTITVKSVDGWVKAVKDIEGIKGLKGIKSIKGDEEVAYIRLSQFGDNTNQDWVALINKLYLQISGNKNFKGVILDLRNNPGGYLTDATFIASEFLKDGVVVIQDKGNGDKKEFSVSRKGLLLNTPLVVLVNKGSASASEIVGGALQDWARAKLFGEQTFGKGTIQQAEDLGNGAGIHVTIAKWLTPKERWVHKKGLRPDIVVNPDEKDKSHDAQLEKAIEELVK